MPPGKKVELQQVDTLANYVINPASTAGGKLFNNHCSSCHGERIPTAQDVSQARQIIASGGPHETMPVWGNVLTSEQMTALTNYTLELAKGTPIEMGQQLLAKLYLLSGTWRRRTQSNPPRGHHRSNQYG
jgi:mono/diheme cytochrome c family protein